MGPDLVEQAGGILPGPGPIQSRTSNKSFSDKPPSPTTNPHISRSGTAWLGALIGVVLWITWSKLHESSVVRCDFGLLWGPIPAPTIGEGPIVRLNYGAFRGTLNGKINSFYNIPYALPPTNHNRYRPPQPIPPLKSPALPPVQDATSFGPSCFQQKQEDLPSVGRPWPVWPPGLRTVGRLTDQHGPTQAGMLYGGEEDCLSLAVHGPAGDVAGDGDGSEGWPVVVWIYGGGFEIGSINQYDGVPIVARSIAQGSPVVYVAMNYRLSGFGFLAGREVEEDGAGNLGLRDQQAALVWVQEHIHLFGGDKNRVTLWGESAGAISASFQMLAPSSLGLFHGVWLNSGSPIPIKARPRGDEPSSGQDHFDRLARAVGCDGVSSGARLACLRRVPFGDLAEAINQSPGLFAYQSLKLPWIPRVDGVFLDRSPFDSLEQGVYAKVPIVAGDCDDEGTLFSLSQLNITTAGQAIGWIRDTFLPEATDIELTRLAELYPPDPTKGSPFGTGYLNQLSPQFKRLAALQGDLVFQAPRRHFLDQLARTQPVWAYNYKRGKATAYLGACHGSELESEFYAPQIGATDFAFMDYLIAFINTGDPNSRPDCARTGASATRGDERPAWPQWTREEPVLLALVDRITSPLPSVGFHLNGLTTELDTFRLEGTRFLTALSRRYPM